MSNAAIPAEIRPVEMWVGFSLSKHPGVVDSQLRFRYGANFAAMRQNVLYVGEDALQLLQGYDHLPKYMEHEEVVTLLSEVVTRADGTQLSLLDLLDAVLTPAAETLLASPTPVENPTNP